MIFALFILFTIGVALIVFPVLFSFKFQRRIRTSAVRERRKRKNSDSLKSLILKENNKLSNIKINRLLKVSGHPWGWTAFHVRLAQLLFPLGAAFMIYALYEIKVAMQGSMQFPIIVFVICTVSGYALPLVLLRLIANKRKEMLAAEIVIFSHRLVVCITDKTPLYYAIKRAGRVCKILKPHIDELLIDWMENPRQAIHTFADKIGINEILPVTNTLLASWNAPEDRLIELFQQQIRNIDTMRDFHIKKKIEVSPLRVTFIIMVPFIVAVALVLMPWYKGFIDILSQNI
ncbi:hypothetical protein [Paenibacillus gansuensis]|uniref:Type II secretion system protein GspF domain-containing protein n=1 Tax=Paenibacillus gansuensis TaxID=306542 RepID=A0ABW5PI46_9BACL